MTDASVTSGAALAAYNEQSKGAAFQWEIAKNNITAMAIELGTMLLPALTTLLSLISGVVGAFGDMPEPIKYVVLGMGCW